LDSLRFRFVREFSDGIGLFQQPANLVAQPWLRFHTPLIEPDVQICRVAQPLLAFAPTDSTVRRYRSGLFRKDPRRADRLAASFTRATFGCKDCQRCVWPFACPRRDPFLPLPFLQRLVSFGDFIDTMERSDSHPRCGELWLSLVRRRRRPPVDADGSHRFRNRPFGRDAVQAPGGASDLSHDETRCAAFAGAGASSASATCRFRESIPHPVQPLSTLRTPRCRDARKTRSRPACSALNGPDFHWQAHSSFSSRAPHPALGQDLTPSSRATPSAASEHLLELIDPMGRRIATSSLAE
jgi:hypothetical protein